MTKSRKAEQAAAVPLLGAHFSTAGGVSQALVRARDARCNVAQIFTASPRQWEGTAVDDAEVEAFIRLSQERPILVAAHAGYLLNPASPDPEIRRKTLDALTRELVRDAALRLPYLVLHPGVAASGEREGAWRLAAEAVDAALEASANRITSILLETTAGQGRSIGCQFEELTRILDLSRHSTRLGVCLDTSHVFAAGYDIRDEETYERTVAQLKRTVGLDRLRFMHLNDSRTGPGSRVDRHEHIGKGQIGRKAFELIMRDPRFARVGKCLETEDDALREQDLRILRRFARS